jgi:hypothetical protein
MPSAVVMGSCLTNLAALFLMSDDKWERPNNAAVLRSDHFVNCFLDEAISLPPIQEFAALVRWKKGFEKEGPRWLYECYRESVGHLEVPLEKPGLFETLEFQQIDVVLMDNLHDTYATLLERHTEGRVSAYSLPFSLSRCENEQDLAQKFSYRPPLTAEESVANWVRIIGFVRQKQPKARILFYCAHACTSVDVPDRYHRALHFHDLLASRAEELGITVFPPLDLPAHLTRMPEDRDHFDMQVYKAMAGHIMLSQLVRSVGQSEPLTL